MRKIFFLAFALVALFASAEEDAFTAVANLGPGWNLGNTLDSHSSSANDGRRWWIEDTKGFTPTDYETAWGQPVTTRELIHMLKASGFNTIRVPVTWYPHLSDFVSNYSQDWRPSQWETADNQGDFDFDIDEDWLARVHEVVGYVLDEGMYCILNTHHESGASDARWQFVDRSNGTANGLTRFSKLWTKIANEFNDYGDHLLFEGYNEILDTNTDWNGTTDKGYEGINQYASAFVSAVRATEGNNATRNLILNTYAAKESSDAITKMANPEQKSLSRHIIYEIHMYPKTGNFKSELENAFSLINSHFVKTCHAPCIIGEWGCNEQAVGDVNTVNMTQFVDMAYYITSRTKDEGIGAVLWMLLVDGADRSTPKWTQKYVGLKDAILKAWTAIDCQANFSASTAYKISATSTGGVTTELNISSGSITVSGASITMDNEITVDAPRGYKIGSVTITTEGAQSVTIKGNNDSQATTASSGAKYYPSGTASNITIQSGPTITGITFELCFDENFASTYHNEFVTALGGLNGSLPANFIANVGGTWKANEINLYDDANYTLDRQVQAAKFTFQRDYVDEGAAANEYWQPLYLPVELPYDAWSQIATDVLDFTGTTSGTDLVFSPVVGALQAHHPYIFKPSGNKVSLTIEGGAPVTVSPAPATPLGVTGGGYTLSGTYNSKSMSTSEYALWNGTFRHPNNDGVTLKPFRVYLTSTAQDAPQRLGIKIGEADPTGIEDISVDSSADTDDSYYDLTGRCVVAPAKGIYIHHGRKVMIK